jgi:hypothetical protein
LDSGERDGQKTDLKSGKSLVEEYDRVIEEGRQRRAQSLRQFLEREKSKKEEES